jgi:hypothetical protein
LNARAGSTKKREADRRATRAALEIETDAPNDNVSF